MRPDVLILRAFGAFPKEETIDFRQLNGKSLFLIHGPTGAGKTTILDGMCFALYGESSGAERNGRTMRSDHADLGAPTEVDFSFRIGPRRFRVSRAPEQERSKRRGFGVTRSPATATLWQQVAEKGEDKWTVVADGWSDVTNAVREITGFDVTQFRQVIILPQGKFEQFLMSGSGAREDILETLFQTELYGQIEAQLKAHASAIQSEVEKYRDEVATFYQAAGVDSAETLKQVISTLERDASEFSESLKGLETTKDRTQRTLADAQTIKAKFVELDVARTALATFAVRLNEIRVMEDRLARHQKARHVEDVVGLTRERRKEKAHAQKACETAVAALQRANVAKNDVEKLLVAEEAKAPLRERLAAKKHELAALKPKVEGIAKAREAKTQAERAANESNTRLNAVRDGLDKARKNLERLQAEREKDLVLAGRKVEAELQAKRLGKVVSQTEKLGKCRDGFERGKATLKQNDKDVATADKALQSAEKAEMALQTRWRKGYAVELAKGLKAGDPCVVCGGKNHPNPAKGRIDHPSDEEIESSRADVKNARDVLQSAREKQVADRGKFDDLAKRISELEDEIGDDAKKAIAALKRELSEAEGIAKQAAEAAKRVDAHDRNLRELKQTEKVTSEQIGRLEPAMKTAADGASAATATLKALEADVPVEYRGAGVMDAALVTATRELDALEQSLRSARDNVSLASQEAAGAQAQEVAARKTLTEFSEALAKAEEGLRARLQAAGFVDEVVWGESLLRVDEADQVEADIKTFRDAYVAAQVLAAQAESGCKGLVMPAMAEIEAAVLVAEEAVRNASAGYATLRERLRLVKGVQAQIQAALIKASKAEADYAVVGGLYETASGKNPHRMSLQRYVLSAMLDSVLSVASAKFLKMSDGRYVLKRKAVADDMRVAGGLDIEALDSYTGKGRPVETLSGGEKFLASLALALSLAEVVQGYAGGVYLESVFVDEGFGSLDDGGTLDRAMQVFSDLQKGGRLVGIISHVGELRERIDARLEVVPERNGSTTKFNI